MERSGDDHGIHLAALEQVGQAGDLLLGRARGVQQDAHVALPGAFGEGVHEAVENDARDAAGVRVEMDADGGTAAHPKSPRRGVRAIAEVCDGDLHATPGGFADDVG